MKRPSYYYTLHQSGCVGGSYDTISNILEHGIYVRLKCKWKGRYTAKSLLEYLNPFHAIRLFIYIYTS